MTLTNKNSKATIVIVGGGLSGTLVAANLLRRARSVAPGDDDKLRIVLIERAPSRLARGVAYSTNESAHLLNVPACNMSAYTDEPDHFLRWCARENLHVEADTFVPRRIFGKYLADVLREAERQAPSYVSLDTREDETVAVLTDEEANCAMLEMRRGGALYADRVVLAVGNYPPSDPWLAASDSSDFYRVSPSYTRDPWQRGALDNLDATRPVLLIGTGLTMVDVALALGERGFRAPLYALSRHGHLPQAHKEAMAYTAFDLPQDEGLTARELLRAVRARVRAAADIGYDWRAVVNALRPLTQKIWRSFDAEEKRRFLRHVRPLWEAHRHRMAPEVARRITQMIDFGALEIRAGRLTSLRTEGAEVEVIYRPRGCATTAGESLRVAQVINCTGPATDFGRIEDALIVSLRERGSLRPDALRLGIETDEDGALINEDGAVSRVLFTLGPLRKPFLWETTAAPEIRVQAAALAALLASSVSDATATTQMFARANFPLESAASVRETSLYDWVI